MNSLFIKFPGLSSSNNSSTEEEGQNSPSLLFYGHCLLVVWSEFYLPLLLLLPFILAMCVSNANASKLIVGRVGCH